MSNIERFTHVNDLQERLRGAVKNGSTGFVPTMGALHEGHLSLIDRALDECDIVVLSIYVNPKQFNSTADLEKYPRDIEADIRFLGNRRLFVFHPEYEDVYPPDFVPASVDIGSLGTVMEGRFRPGHFDGVVTVVSRLFDIVEPDRAYFGEKDYQQLAVIQRMVAIQQRKLTIVPCSITREVSGLAMSSRNRLLSTEEHHKATGIHRILHNGILHVSEFSPVELTAKLINDFEREGFDLEYLSITDPSTLEQLDRDWVPGARVFVACFMGTVRLIDNIALC